MSAFKNRASENVEALVDPASRAIVVDIDHDNIHLGKEFRSWINAGSLAAGASVNILIKTGAKEVHWRPSNPKPTSDKLRVKFFKDATASADGTPLPKINANQVIDAASTIGLFSGPTLTADGSQLHESFLPGATGVGGVRNGSELGPGAEWPLKPSTNYLIRYTNESSGASILNVTFDWYEI